MKVRMLTISADVNGTHQKGDVVDVKEAEAKELVEGNFAEYVDKPAPKKSKQTKE